VYANNDEQAALLRDDLTKQKRCLMNLMSSPGSGKTTTLVRTIEALKNTWNLAVIEADIDSDVDANTISKTGAKTIQLHTGGMCHVDANMTKGSIATLGSENIDCYVMENVGNLVCPASYDIGAHLDVMILSVPEGDDKPLKYPKMFKRVDALIINKMDALEFFDFDLEALKQRVKKLNPNIKIFPISAKNNTGILSWTNYLSEQIEHIRRPTHG
jgi:hydrogenase nickel incorporation protein HypB